MLQRVIDYNANQAINQSRLKKLLGNEDPKTFLMDIELTSKSVTVGSLVDCMLTSPEEFNNDYYVSQLENLPSETIQNIVKEQFSTIEGMSTPETVITDNIQDYMSILVTGELFAKYQANWKLDTKVNKIVGEGAQYFRELVLSRGKQIVSQNDYQLAEIVANSIKNNPDTSWVFNYNTMNHDVIRLFQHPIYFKLNGIECKALLDLLIIDLEKKEVTIVDIKTMSGHVLSFESNAKSFNYNLQMAFYYLAVKSLIIPNGPFEEYNIKCGFLVESTTHCGTPVYYECTKDFIEVGLYGIPERIAETNYNYPLNFKEQEGIIHLLKKYKYYLENGWQKNQRIIKHNSHFKIDWFGIV